MPLEDSSMLKDVRSCLSVPGGQGRGEQAKTQGAIKTVIFMKGLREKHSMCKVERT